MRWSRPRTATTAGSASRPGGPKCVITDWAMPGFDGTELTARIRSLEGGGYTYIMVLSARADEYAQRDAVRAGADDVLAKPLDPAELERGLIAAERLVTMHRRMTSDLRRDPVTGAGSRVRLDEDLAALCARVARYGHTYCVAMIGLAPGSDDGVRRVGAALTAGDPLRRRALPLRAGAVRRAPARAGAGDREPGREPAAHRRPSRPPRPGRRSASGSSRRAQSPSRRRCWPRRRRRSRRPPRRPAGCCTAAARAAGCGCSWPTTTPCRG